MKTIMFTMKDGSKMNFNQLTGFEIKRDIPEDRLGEMAQTALEVDPSIKSFEIVEVK